MIYTNEKLFSVNLIMMLWHWNTSRITGPFVRGESTSHQGILQTNVSEMWSFGASFVSLTEQDVEQSRQAPIIWTKWASYQTYKIAACAENAGNVFPATVGWRYRHQGTCVTHVPWCMLGLLASGFLWNQWRRKHSQHSQRMCNPQFYVSGTRPMTLMWRRGIGFAQTC